MKQFKPTYLMVKWHPVDPSERNAGKGLFYFCKTTKSSLNQMLNYKGSGDHWKAHLRKYGNAYVETLWWELFTDKDKLVQTALLFSKQQDITRSRLWANEKPENGLDGGEKGKKQSVDTCNKKSIGMIGVNKGRKNGPQSVETIALKIKVRTGLKHKNHKKCGPQQKVTCPHCGKEGGKGNMQRYHFDNCKLYL
jgi:hypothetical protein